MNNLSDEELQPLVVDTIPILHDLGNGMVYSQRYVDFQSSPSRRDLMFNAGMERFTEDQHHLVLSVLLKEFEPEKKKIDANFLFLV